MVLTCPQSFSPLSSRTGIDWKSVLTTACWWKHYGREMMKPVITAIVELNLQKTQRDRLFEMEVLNQNGGRAKLVYTKKVSVNMALQIQHWSLLMIHNLKWLVTEHCISNPPFCCPIFEASSLNSRELLATALDQFCGNVEAENLMRHMLERAMIVSPAWWTVCFLIKEKKRRRKCWKGGWMVWNWWRDNSRVGGSVAIQAFKLSESIEPLKWHVCRGIYTIWAASSSTLQCGAG